MRWRGIISSIGSFTLWICCFGSRVYAQTDTLVCYPDRVCLDSSRISGNTQALVRFFEQLDTLEREGRGTVSVLHLGDSHIQAGFYSEIVRNGFQHDFGNAGRGLIVPLRLSGTNEPPDYTITSSNVWQSSSCIKPTPEEVGLSGLSLYTTENCMELTLKTQEPFDLIRAFHHRQAPLLTAPDSLTDGPCCPEQNTDEMTLIPLNTSTTQVTLQAQITDSVLCHPAFYGFSLENGTTGVLYHSIGVNGNMFSAVNRNPQMIRQAARLAPALIIVSLGTNDSFGRNFRTEDIDVQINALIHLIQTHIPTATLLLTTPMECYNAVRTRRGVVRKPNPNTPSVRSRILVQAERHHLPVWDFYTIAGGETAMQRWSDKELARPDKIHLTRSGYELQGTLLYEAIRQAYMNYKQECVSSPSFD